MKQCHVYHRDNGINVYHLQKWWLGDGSWPCGSERPSHLQLPRRNALRGAQHGRWPNGAPHGVRCPTWSTWIYVGTPVLTMAKLVKITKLTMVYVDKYSFHGGHNIVALTFFTKERMKNGNTPNHYTTNGMVVFKAALLPVVGQNHIINLITFIKLVNYGE